MIYVMLTQGRSPYDFDPTPLIVQLRKHPGSATDLVSVLKLAKLYAGQAWSELEALLQNRAQRAQDPLAEALSLAIRGAALERAHKSGVRAWQASMHCLKNSGLALPPEIHHFKPNFDRYKDLDQKDVVK